MAFSDKLISIRKAQHLSQAKLAQKCGLSQAAISAIEKGIRSPTESTILLIANALGCTPADMLGDDVTADEAVLEAQKKKLYALVDSLSEDQCNYFIDMMETMLKIMNTKG